MKKLLLVTIAVALMLAVAVSAQDAAPKATGLTGKGIKAGFIMGNATGDSLKSFVDATGGSKKARMGFGGGAFITYHVAPIFAIQPEILYMMKGMKIEKADTTLSFKADYLEIPVLLKITPEMQGNIKANIFAGPYFSFLMSAKEKLEGTGSTDYDDDVKDSLKSTDLGITFGAGADFVAGKGTITLDVRYDLGFSKIREKNAIVDDTKTNALAIFLGYSF